jgi:hypothetical protein
LVQIPIDGKNRSMQRAVDRNGRPQVPICFDFTEMRSRAVSLGQTAPPDGRESRASNAQRI